MSQTKELINPPAELEDCLDLEAPEQGVIAINEKKKTFEEVVTGLARWYLYTDAKLRGLEAEYRPIIERLEGDLTELEGRKKYIKSVLSQIIAPSLESTFVSEAVSVFFTATTQLKIDSPALIPIEYCKPPKEPEPDGDAIKEVLKNGGEVEGARLQQNFHIQIKEGGVRAAKNARLRSDKRVKRITENEMAA